MTEKLTFWMSPAGGAAIALAGVLVVTLVSSVWEVVKRRWQLADHKRKIAIEKGEQAYGLIKRWNDFSFGWFLNCTLVMNHQISYNDFLDLIIKSHEDHDLQVDKIEFIIVVHFPELNDNWQHCVKLIQAASKIESDFKLDYKNGLHTGNKHLRLLSNAISDAHNQIEDVLKKLTNSVRSKL